MEPETTAEPAETTTTTTTGETTTTAPGTATEAIPTTGPTPTTGTTAEDATTTTTGETTAETTTTTGETETGGETTGTVIPSTGPFESCNNVTDVDCDGNAVCVDGASTSGKITGAFCAPKCMGQGSCPQIQGLAPNVQPVCAFDTDMDSKADICALLCVMASDNCPQGSKCEDIGIPEMQMMKFGVCTWPPA
ncbi:hypothetical protein [Nannocystis pusilla]|uniref:Uncharacterized protein n=1 Tax=Nannocystis pusilla TaxID=889268 RepID=A0ABS7U5E4_9BACT|nr:hypothetical protein [Nannocystis pusilla]MBZ5715629.1 hypothetical protein [Nannocystis pusilla]